MRKTFILLGLAAAFAAAPVFGLELKEDSNYKVVSLARSEQPKVVEFFSYGCPHCFEFEPHVQAWLAGKPADVQVQRVPVSFGREEWGYYAQAYYLGEALKVLDKSHQALFERIHKDGKRMQSEDDLVGFFVELGQDEARVRATLKSFAVQSRLKQAEHLIKKYQIMTVPNFIVNEQYQVLVKGAETPEGLTLDNLGAGLTALTQKQ